MKENLDERAVKLGEYIVGHSATVRQAAAVFKISKSTVHKDITSRLKEYNLQLYTQVKAVLDENKEERHLRGGLATKRKYEALQHKNL